MAYRVKKEFLKFENLTTLVEGKRVALISAYTHTTEGTLTKPPKTVNVPLATQEEMKAIFERGDPCVERYEEKEQKPFFDHKPENPFDGVKDSVLEEHGIKAKETKQKSKYEL